jgi:hypothetical protein
MEANYRRCGNGCGTCLSGPPTSPVCPRCRVFLAVEQRLLDAWLDLHVRFDAYCAQRDHPSARAEAHERVRACHCNNAAAR